MPFPPGFLWGAATAAAQIEGATAEDGRGPDTWDAFSRRPDTIERGESPETACDHYHRWASDVDLLAELGIPVYRFSTSWARVQPDGRGPLNEAGLDFYERLVDRLVARGIRPMLTLSHLDLPLALEAAGGWTVRSTAERFAVYADAVMARLGDRVDAWITGNELYAGASLGYLDGAFPPGHTGDLQGFVAATHHLLLAHGLGTQAYRARGLRAPIGCTFGQFHVVPATDDPADVEAARRWELHERGWFFDAFVHGAYPAEVLALYERAGVDLSCIRGDDLATIAGPADFAGVNYYTRMVVRADPAAPLGWATRSDGWTGAGTTDMGWQIDPDGLRQVLVTLHRHYPDLPLIVTESGTAMPDSPDAAGFVDDADRIAYLRAHIAACEAAIGEGVDLRGYVVWAFMDNFEWSAGYRPRFGLVRVDYPTQRRIPKASAAWYRRVIEANGLPAEERVASAG